jgi:hypothetical protein
MMRNAPPSDAPSHRRHLGRVFTGLALVAALAGCPTPHSSYPQPAKVTTVAAVVALLDQARAATTSFRGASVMDYWLGQQRVKGSMLVMGTVGAKVRFNALSPAGESVMADLACNGRDFVMVDFQNNCVLTGPCNQTSIAQLLRISLAPDDFLQMALGNTPVLPQASGAVKWDASNGHLTAELRATTGSQVIVLDGRDDHWDVLSSELRDPAGGVVWKVENNDFTAVKDATGKTHRVPGSTRLQQPAQKADLLVEWEERSVNVDLESSKFELAAPAGLPTCGAQPATKPPAAPAAP